MARVLEMSFSTELGKTQTIRVNDAKETLTAAEVKAAMDNIVAKNIFSGTGGIITGKISARVTTSSSSELDITQA